MKKSLFNEYEAYTPEGRALTNEIQAALEPIIKKWADMGYLVNNIESISIDTVAMVSNIEIMTRAARLQKERRSGETRETREI